MGSRLVAVVLLILLHAVPFPAQEQALTVSSASPQGEIAQLDDAHEIRLTFSHPMVAIGEPEVAVPAWITVEPALPMTASWSGTRTLLLSPASDTALPFGTSYRVIVSADAQAVSGARLGRPFSFTFTTPTARLVAADWYRQDGQVSQPVFIRLRFNQPMDPLTALRHIQVAAEPHEAAIITLTDAERAEWQRADAQNLARFDARVAAVRAVARSAARVPVATADTWNRERFPDDPHSIIIRTEVPPVPGTWLKVTLDDRLTGRAGTVPHPTQSTVIQLEEAFLPIKPSCVSNCDPDQPWGMTPRVSRGMSLDTLRANLSVAEIIDGREQRLTPDTATTPSYRPSSGHFGFDAGTTGYPAHMPATTRIYYLDAGATSLDGQVLGFRWRMPVTTGHSSAYAMVGGGIWEAAGGTAVPLLTRNVGRVDAYLHPFQPVDIVNMWLTTQPRPRVPPLPPVSPHALTLAAVANRNEAHPVDLRTRLGGTGTGLLWAAFSPTSWIPGANQTNAAGSLSSGLLQVTNLALTVKDSPVSTLAWVTTLDTARPVANARVIIRNMSNDVLWSGTTGADGVAMAPALPLRSPQRAWETSFIVSAEKDQDVTWLASSWLAEPGGSRPVGHTAELRGSIFTDRGVYALGDEVRIKAILRRDAAEGVRPLASGSRLQGIVRDGRGQEAGRADLTVSEWSSAEWVWRIPPGGALGRYWIDVRDDSAAPAGAARGGFMVAAFRRPDFGVDVTASAAEAVLGATISGHIDAKFLFGAPIGRQPVRWTVHQTPAHDVPSAIRERFPIDRHAFGYTRRWDTTPRWEPPSISHDERLPQDGRLPFSQATRSGPDHAVRFDIEANVEGPSGQFIANRSAVVLHPADLYVGIVRPPTLVNAAQPLVTEWLAAGLDGSARAGIPVRVSLLREEWTTERTEVAVGSWPVTTTDGRVPLSITIPQDGAYILRAVGQDSRGRPTRTEVSFYAYGKGRGRWRAAGNVVQLIPERQTWQPGEQARLLVQTPWDEATALVTMEREGVRRYTLHNLTPASSAITVPITDADVPNVSVSVVLLKGRTTAEGADHEDPGKPDYRVGHVNLTVADAGKRLRVEVQADRAEYQPRDRVRVHVRVHDRHGAPKRGEVTVWAMDEGLLALTNYTLPDVARAIYADRAVQVHTTETRTRLIPRRTPSPPAAPGSRAGRGGGGGGVAGGVAVVAGAAVAEPPPPAPPPPGLVGRMTLSQTSINASDFPGVQGDPSAVVRDNFRPLAFWAGSLVTGEDGQAETTVSLPDSVTRYRIMAVAGDLASHFGVGESAITTSLPLTLLPALPRFLVVGNRASFGAVITNNSAAGGTARVEVAALDGSPLVFDGAMSQTITLAPGASAPIRFDARAQRTGQARVRITARMGALVDAFEIPVPVNAPAPMTTVAAYGDTTTRARESLRIPDNVIAGAGGLTLTLASTALAGLSGSATFLDEYPYDCAEPLASRALAQLLAADLQGAFGTGGESRESLRAKASATLTSLARFKCGDGGYGPFATNCQSSPYLTAYIVHVMRTAQSLQVAVDQDAMENALSYLEQRLPERPSSVQQWPAWAATQAYMVKVITESGRRQPATAITELANAADRMPVYALSYLADALRASGDTASRYTDIVRRLTNRLRVSADRAFVEELDDASLMWLWHSNVRATAVVLEGLVRRGDQSDLIAPLARWLAAERSDNRWRTTQEHAISLHAMVTYHRVREFETPQMTVETRLGASLIGTTRFEGRSTTVQQVVVLANDLPKGTPTDLVLERTGTGRVHYTARLQYQPATPPGAESRGLRLTRTYARLVDGTATAPATTFSRGDIVRVTVSLWVPHEGRFLAITDPVPAGLEPIDGALNTTARDIARIATQQSSAGSWLEWWRRGGFQHVDKHDDRVVAFATRLAPGRHEFSYLARAMTAGTFETAGTWGEAMYAPEITGRAAAQTIVVK